MCENNLFECLQSAYRANHSVETALTRVLNDLLVAVDNKKVAGLVLLDLSAAFDTVNHSVLLDRLKNRIGINGLPLEWFHSYLGNMNQRISIRGKLSDAFRLSTGVPQGSVLGPLLFSIYMGPLGDVIRKHNICFHFFADDTQLYICFYPEETADAMARLQACINDVRQWMARNFLKLNDDKTEFLLIHSKHQATSDLPVSIQIGDHDIVAVPVARNIGALVDQHLTMERHIKNVCKSCYFHLHNIGLIRKYLTTEATATLVSAYVTSRLDGLNAILVGLPQQTLYQLQKVQNSAARLISRTSRREHITPVLQELHWLRVCDRIEFKILLLTYKCINGSAPTYLQELVTLYCPTRNLRSVDNLLLAQPRSRLASFGDRAFSRAAPRLWNKLPLNVRASSSVSVFKRSLKTHLFLRAAAQ